MSALQTSERFRVQLCLRGAFAHFGVYDLAQCAHVDAFRTESAARYAARLLNDDLATVNPHGLVGCRVEVK